MKSPGENNPGRGFGISYLSFPKNFKAFPEESLSKNSILGNRWLTIDGYHTELKCEPKTGLPAGI